MIPGELYSCDGSILYYTDILSKRWHKIHAVVDDLLLCIAVKRFNDTVQYTFLSSFHGIVAIQSMKDRDIIGLSRVA